MPKLRWFITLVRGQQYLNNCKICYDCKLRHSVVILPNLINDKRMAYFDISYYAIDMLFKVLHEEPKNDNISYDNKICYFFIFGLPFTSTRDNIVRNFVCDLVDHENFWRNLCIILGVFGWTSKKRKILWRFLIDFFCDIS